MFRADMPGRFDTTLINLALAVLRAAAYRSTKEPVGTIEVRLALRVLRRPLGSDDLLLRYWQSATEMPRHPWISCHLPYRWITQSLEKQGWTVSDENQP